MEELTRGRGRTVLSRRQLLIGGAAAAAGGVLLAACGDDGGTEAGPTTAPTGDDRGLALAQFFGGAMFVAGQPARLPFGVVDRDALLVPADTPASLEVQVLGPDGAEVGGLVEVARHYEGLPRAYFPLRTTFPEPGIYTVRTTIDGTATEMSVQAHGAADVKVIQPGTAMPALDTPTAADPRGVDPVCTNDPVCALHDATVAEVLHAGAPLALLVSTPAFCQLAICGPVLEVLLDVVPEHPEIRFLHAEVFSHPHQNRDDYAPVVSALGLHFEPCLVLVGSDGTIVERLDTIFDRAELADRLTALA